MSGPMKLNRKNMEEQLYRVEGTLTRWFLAGKREPLMTTGAIVGETEANNWRKYLGTSMPGMYFRMVPTTIEESKYYQAPFADIMTNELKAQNS